MEQLDSLELDRTIVNSNRESLGQFYSSECRLVLNRIRFHSHRVLGTVILK